MRGKGEGTIFKDSRGLWTAKIELPPADNGDRRRKVVRSRDKAVVIGKLRELQRDLAQHGDLATSSMTVEQWMTYWLETIAPARVRPLTLANYRSLTQLHIVPAIGPVRLDKLTAAHVRGVHRRMLQPSNGKPKSSTYARNVHRVLAKALADAVRDGRTTRNAALNVDVPVQARTTLEALDVEEAVKVLARVVPAFTTDPYDPTPALFATYLLTGTRRGEVIGLERDRVSDVLDLSWQLQRLKKGEKFQPDFEYRQVEGGLYWTRPKTKAGWRIIPLVDPLRTMLLTHLQRAPQNRYGLVFTRPNGLPFDPSEVSRTWRSFSGGITDKHVRLHDLRHTTVDLLYEAGVPEDIIQEIVGHSTRSMTRAYKSVGNVERLRGAMLQLSALLGTGSSS